MRWILAIDPGDKQSAYVLLAPDLRPVRAIKMENELMYDDIVQTINLRNIFNDLEIAIEMIASYGMPVGAEVFETCMWIGVIRERFRRAGLPVKLIYRKDEKMNLCHSMKANDANIRQALVDRFAPGEPNYGKGTIRQPGWFYGFRADMWAAYAVGVTYADMYPEDD